MSVINVKQVTKEFRLGQLTSLRDNLNGMLARLRGRPVPERKAFKALDDINFEVQQGEVVGIIGQNGAGKSTLLKIISNVVQATSGTVHVKGKVAPLIEVGAGLIGDLTGRENIFLNGSILGIRRREIKSKLDAIVSFAELEEFIDTPIKRYSSGMKVRLGFSIATSIDADILIVDEVLAVGDLAFQRKCFDRMEEMIRKQGNTVLLVSHNIRQVERMCSRAIMLDHGRVLKDGAPNEVCGLFYSTSNEKIREQQTVGKSKTSVRSSGEIELKEITLFQSSVDQPVDSVGMHEPLRIGIRFHANCDLTFAEIIIGFHTTDFVYVVSNSSYATAAPDSFNKGAHLVYCELEDLPLMPGVYGIRLGFLDKNYRWMWYGEGLKFFNICANLEQNARAPKLGLVDLPFQWRGK